MSTNSIVVIINGENVVVNKTFSLSFRDVAHLAGFESALPTITLRQKGVDGRILHSGESVMPIDGMIFNVADTSNA